MPIEPHYPPRVPDEEQEIAAALAALRRGAPEAMERLVPLVYGELRRIAHRHLAAERGDHTLSTTAVVHEVYLRLAEQRLGAGGNRAQFFALAARVMRRVLTDYARRHRRLRRGGPSRREVALEDADAAGIIVAAERAEELLEIDAALERLAALDPRQAQVVECRFFGGLSEDETAQVLGVTTRTVERDWVKARGWLYQALSDDVA